ncbi:hypothetical protein ACLKMH_06160 [Psychromonas sp. KJ10-10]|uniref:hypothetical protein n=1 Tax=Psychromonas sp. KJ10-10 TaxID=3391823 RepID=UPI0039B440AE
MDYYIQKYSEFILSLTDVKNAEFPDSAFLVSEHEQISSGHSISGVFCHTAKSINENSLNRICDFIIYENSKNRRPCIAVEDTTGIYSVIKERLNQLPNSKSIRKSDPNWVVHATNFRNGKAIIQDGKIKSQKRLIDEKYFSEHQLGYKYNNEPVDYLDHINFAINDSIWPETVVSSNQSGSIGDFDEPYNPGIRFYINAHDLIKSGLVIRTGAPFLKVVGELSFNDYLNYPISIELFDEQIWTPRTFTVATNNVFMEIFLKIPEKFHNVKYVASRIPGVPNESDMSLGANCQVFAYNLLRALGLNPPTLRSSELWSESEFTTTVDDFKELDIMLYNKSQESYGAHLGIYVGHGIVYHLSKDNGIPKFEKHLDLLKQSKYSRFIGAKRVNY